MDGGVIFWIVVGAMILFFVMLNRGIKAGVEFKFKSKVRDIEQEKQKALSEIAIQHDRIVKMRAAFDSSHVQGRRWLIHLITAAELACDTTVEQALRNKSRPAHKAADEVKRVKYEKRQLLEQVKHFEYMLRMLYEEFPILGDYEEDLINDSATLNLEGDFGPEADLVAALMSAEDYNRLSVSARNQLALDRWVNKNKSNVDIGRMYERFIGSGYEAKGWRVQFHGATEGLEDLGRDLICEKGQQIDIVQAKCWAAHKTIHEKHIFQLYGTTFLYGRRTTAAKRIRGVLFCTSNVSDVAKDAADALGLKILRVPLDRDYPMIKCNVNGKDKIYHLPFDQQYDRVRIGSVPGECYVKTVAEAERQGFRRAKRWVAGT